VVGLHRPGYRNFSCKDASRNIVAWGILIGGEELHNNHHAYASSAKLSSQWYEFDLGWMYIRGLEMFGLATVRRVAPRLKLDSAKRDADLETLQSIITHRYAVLTSYARSLKQAYTIEVARQRERRGEFTPNMPSFRRLRQWFQTDESALAEADRARLVSTLEQSTALQTIYAMGRDLATIWERSTDSREELLARLQDWCHRAEASNVVALQSFSRRLRSFA
jgi:stearoyl-CoA desaturase (Delta-9 desaturase)